MRREMLVFGAGGHGSVVIDCAQAMGRSVVAIVDDDSSKVSHCGLPVVAMANVLDRLSLGIEFIVAIGDNSKRREVCARMTDLGGKLCSLIHPSAVVSRHTHVGIGTVIMPGVVVNCGVQVGRGCIINTGSSVDHDCILEDFVHLGPGVRVAGGVTIGRNSFLGIGSLVIPGKTIGRGVVLGAGSVVVQDLPDHIMAFGNPARLRRFVA